MIWDKKDKSQSFERVILIIMGLAMLSLLLIAIQKPEPIVPKSPTVSFSETDTELPKRLKSQIRPFDSSGLVFVKNVTVDKLSETFSTLEYDFNNVRDQGAAVPRVFVDKMPRDMPEIQVPAEKKRMFFKLVLPLVLQANNQIMNERKRLLNIFKSQPRFEKLSPENKAWLVELCNRYNIDTINVPELKRRVDIIPPSLALAQAAEESGWGTSRFAMEGNALFGQWTFANKDSLIPKERDRGKIHRVRTFSSLLHAVQAYLHNLNTHHAYWNFRSRRAKLRKVGKHLTGVRLAKTLVRYSERGKKYVRTIQSIIKTNRLHNLDKARFDKKIDKKRRRPII